MSDEAASAKRSDWARSARSVAETRLRGLRQIGLLALVALATVIAISATLEIGARILFPSADENRCSLPGGRFAKFCTTRPMKLWEGPWFTEAYNDCGFRTAEPCSLAPPGLRRVAVIGTSQAHGMDVPYDQTFAARATARLKSDCGGPVDFQNLSLPGAFIGATPLWHEILTRMPQALALRPVAIITILSSNDLATYEAPPSSLSTVVAKPTAESGWGRGPFAWLKRLRFEIATGSAAILAIRGAVFHDTEMYLSRFLETGRGDFMARPLDAKWRMRLRIADQVLGPMAAEAKAAGVRFVAFYYPSYPQAIAAKDAKKRPDLAPYALQQGLRAIVEAHGGVFMDITPAVAAQPRIDADYYVSNDHPNGRGHAVMADQVVKGLIAAVPAFAGCRVASR